jgi:6-phosphogluconolactonase
MARETLLDGVPLPAQNVHRVRGEERRWAVASYVDSVRGWRVTLTPVVINAALNMTFIVSGKAKAERVAQVLKGPYPPEALPAQLISPVDGRLLWLLDTEAATLL